jgi:signal transduction histidine kinase
MVSGAPAALTSTGVRRETRALIGSLIVFVAALIVTLLVLAVSILRMDRLAAIADTASGTMAGVALVSPRDALEARRALLRAEYDIARIETHRGAELFAADGARADRADVITRELPGGARMAFYFDSSAELGGRRATLIVGAFATLATLSGLLILIVYLPKFVRPIEEMLAQARQINTQTNTDDDARYLVQTFRDAVGRLQQQENELEHFRHAATSRTPDLRELARTLNRSFSSGFLSIDSDGLVVAINEAGRQVLSLDERPEPFAMEQLGDPSFVSVLQASFNSRSGVSRREVKLTGSGALIGVTTVPLFDDDAFLGLLALFTDLTTFRAMEGRLRDLESLIALGHVSAGIAHEFRNSLFTIHGYLRLAERTASEEPLAKIRSAQAEAMKLASAVDALLNFTRPLTFRSQRLDLTDIMTSVVQQFRQQHADVTIELDAQPVEINGDRELLERAIENVVRNAIDAVRQQHPDGGGVVRVAVTSEPHATITIADNGVGLDPEKASTLLLPFQSGKPHGFGLGLPLARKIVLHHGGTLSLTGQPAAGATVTVEFFG